MGTAPREPTLTLDPARPACVHRWSHSRDLCSAVHRVLAVIATSDAAPSGADAHRVAVAQQPPGRACRLAMAGVGRAVGTGLGRFLHSAALQRKNSCLD